MPAMRTTEEQVAGLQRVSEKAIRRSATAALVVTPGDVATLNVYSAEAPSIEIVYAVGGYDVWRGGDLIETDLSEEQAVETLVRASRDADRVRQEADARSKEIGNPLLPGRIYCKYCYEEQPCLVGADGSLVVCEVCGYGLAPLDRVIEAGSYDAYYETIGYEFVADCHPDELAGHTAPPPPARPGFRFGRRTLTSG